MRRRRNFSARSPLTERISAGSRQTTAARNSLAYVLRFLGKHSDVVSELKAALKFNNNNVDAHYLLGLEHRSVGNDAEAIAEFYEASRADPIFAAAHFELGNALRDNKQDGTAIEQHQEAISNNPNYSDAHSNLGVVLKGAGRNEAALLEFQEAIKSNPRNSEAHYELAGLLQDIGNIDDAIAEHREALKGSRRWHSAKFRVGLADALRAAKNNDAAIKEYLEVGDDLMMSGAQREAVTMFRTVLEIDPHNATALKRIEATAEQPTDPKPDAMDKSERPSSAHQGRRYRHRR